MKDVYSNQIIEVQHNGKWLHVNIYELLTFNQRLSGTTARTNKVTCTKTKKKLVSQRGLSAIISV